MKSLKSSAGSAGYDQEELYFFQKDQELIQGVRKSHLRLIQGGKSENSDVKAEGSNKQNEEKVKKAA